MVGSAATSGSSFSNLEPGAAVGVIRAPVETLGPRMTPCPDCFGCSAAVRLVTAITTAATRTARIRWVDPERNAGFVIDMRFSSFANVCLVLVRARVNEGWLERVLFTALLDGEIFGDTLDT